MIKKYQLSNNSLYSKSVICLFYEGKIKINITQRYIDDLPKLFVNPKDIKYNGLDTPCFKETVTISTYYINDSNNQIDALILCDTRNRDYYLLTSDKTDNKKFYFKDKSHGDSKSIESDYEKNKLRKNYGGTDKHFIYDSVDYLDPVKSAYELNKNNKLDADVVAYSFFKSQDNKFSTDFVQLFQNRIYRVSNTDFNERWVSLNLNEMSKTRKKRFDCFFIDNNGEVKYFIYTNIRHDIIHYYLFKNEGNKNYKFLLECTCLKELLLESELSSLIFRHASVEENNVISKIWFRDYVIAKESEKEEDAQLEIEEKIEQELEEFADEKINDVSKVFKGQEEIINFIESLNGYIEKGLVMFKDFEDFPLASLGNGCIKIRSSRYPNNVEYSAPLSIKPNQQNKVYSKLADLLIKKPSSRLIELEKLINKAIEYDAKDDSYIVNEIKYLNDSLLESDKNYPPMYYDHLVEKYNNWKKVDLNKVDNKESQPLVVEKEKNYSRSVNKGKKLIIIGATVGKGTIDLIKKTAIKEFGFKKNDIQTYGFSMGGLDVNSLQNQNKIDNAILIIGATDHKVTYLSSSDSLKGAIENNPDKYPKAKFVVDSRNHLCNITHSKAKTLLTEFRDEGIIN